MLPQVQPEITVGEYDVVDNGVVTSPDNKPITITLGQNLVIEFRFDYEGDGEARYTAEAVEDKLIINLENFQSGVVMGGTTPPIGVIEPITIGQIFNRELLVHFQVSTSKSDNKTAISTLYYTFYAGDTVENEGQHEGDDNVDG